MFENFLPLLTELVKNYGILAYFLLVTFGSIIPVIPVEVLLMLAVAAGFDPFLLFLLTTIGSTLGAVVIFFAAFEITRMIVKREGKTMKKAVGWVKKYGSIAVFVGAFTPLPFDPIVIAAGALKMNFKIFLFATVLGRAIRFAFLIYVGQAVIGWLF